ncbi:MAG: polyprenyl synthetase family protein [Saprospiraceae bacterium]
MKHYLQLYIDSFQAYLEKTKVGHLPASLYDPAQYILDLGGKRIRPILVLLGTHLYDETFSRALPAAFSIEVFHNFTLAHDDIMDNADVRRGKATMHKKFSLNQAILTGDAMMIHSFKSLLSYEELALSRQLMEVFTNMAVGLCEGQQMDMDFELENTVSIGDYIKMIELKTAILLGAALKIGALIGFAPQNDAEHLYQFGLNFGIAFQLQDDVLDVFGDGGDVGKKIGGDIIQNKKTYLYLKALELAGDEEKKELLYLYSDQHNATVKDKVERVTTIFKSLVVKEYAQQVMEAYRDLAVSHIYSTTLLSTKKEILVQFIDDFLHRKS